MVEGDKDATVPAAEGADPAGPAPHVDLEEVVFPRAKRGIRRLPRLFGQAFALVRKAAPRQLAISAALQVVLGVGIAAQLLLVRHVLSRLVTGGAEGTFSVLIPPLLVLAAVGAVVSFANLARSEQQRILAEQVGRYATGRVLDVSSAVDLIAYERPEFADRLQRAAGNAHSRPLQVANGLLGFLGGVVAIAGLSVALLALQPLFLAVVVVAYVPAWLAANRAGRLLHDFSVLQTERDRRRTYLFNVLSRRDEAAEVRSYGLARYLHRWHDVLYDQRIADLRLVVRRRMRVALAGQLVSALVPPAAMAALVWLISEGQMTVATAVASAGALILLNGRLSGLIRSASQLYEASLFLEDFTDFIEAFPVTDRRDELPPTEAPAGFTQLDVDHVTFTYPSRTEPSLRDVSITIGAGEVVALVGENGSGKTTLAKLLARLYAPDEGSISWDGVDIATIDGDQLRRSIAVIFQDFVQYRLTAGENVTTGRHERYDDTEAMEAAARAAGAHGFLAALPRGYRTRMGPQFMGGSDLSVGQWQRVALARAFFRDAPFVILDEPTASLDPRAELALFGNIRTIFAGRSVLVISHRFANVRAADRIYVLGGGQVVEHGSHDQLMAAAGIYAELFTMQASTYLDPA